MSKKMRTLAVLAAAAALFPLVVASPASAATTCETLVYGPTPSVEVDTNNDGNPEARVPSLTNARLCYGADVVLTDSPSWWSEPCAEWGTCWRFFVHYGLSGYADTHVQLCFELDGRQVCSNTKPVHVPIDVVQGGTMCIGVDAGGGRPCAGGTALIAFE